MNRFVFFSSKFLPLLLIAFGAIASAAGQEVDVYFITGQSNATNLGESSGADGVSGNEEQLGSSFPFTDVGFNLEVARIGDRSSRDPDVTTLYGDDPNDNISSTATNVQPNYSSSNLNDDKAITTLATELHDTNDMAIFTFARGGRPLANSTTDSGESWYPGSSDISIPANQYNAELYGKFRVWGQNRIDEVEDGPDGIAGNADDVTAVVKGIFWFQGETDVTLGSAAVNAYETNYTNLIARFREDFGASVPVVAAHIRVTNSATLQNAVNAALNAVADADPLVGVVPVNDLIPQGNAANNVHLDKGFQTIPNQYVIVAERFAAKIANLDSEPPVTGPVTTSATPPAAADLIASDLDETGIVISRCFSEAGNNNHARGLPFSLGAQEGGFEITALTIKNAATQTFDNDSITVRFWQANQAPSVLDWVTGTGHTQAANGDDYFVGTTVTPLYSEKFTLTGVFLENDYVTFTLATPLMVSANSDFGFLLNYEEGDGTLNNFAYEENTSGGRMAVTTTAHVGGSSRGIIYGVHQASPSVVLLGDVNLDGEVDFLDISPFIAVLSGGTFQAEADCDESGEVDFLDISPFIAILSGS